MARSYRVELFNLIQEACRAEDSKNITLSFLDELYSAVVKKLKQLEPIWGVEPLDDETIKNYYESAKKKYIYINGVKADPATSLVKGNQLSWLTEKRKNKINWNYTNRYWEYLSGKGRADTVIDQTKISSENILGNLGDPESSSSFFIKGLVVGEVQSGKTENFNAVINRAIDSGYQLILVFSGIMEDLRVQTQDRIESDVIGFGSVDANGIKWAKQSKKGVGHTVPFGMFGDKSVLEIDPITSCETDFSTHRLRSRPALTSKKILICKKNVSVLKNLINWLGDMSESSVKNIPLLVLDDEADNASLNNEGAKGREYASKVNGHIRAILAMFDKKSYLGYTATPFANVLADRNDPAEGYWPVKHRDEEREFIQENNLFPDDFIFRLKSPTNYIGAQQLFDTIAETPKLPVISITNDHIEEFPTRLLKTTEEPVENIQSKEEWENKTKDTGQYAGFFNFNDYRKATRAAKRDDNFPNALPQSLKDAVLCFILAIAVRATRETDMRGSNLYEPNNTMLIHTSLFTTWQNETAGLLETYLEEITHRIENDSLDQINSIYIRFENIWNRYFAEITENIRDYVRSDYVDAFMKAVPYELVRSYLPSAVEKIKVRAINSYTGDKLNYSDDEPSKYIAVGGNRLSRGFTVRGLSINYFIRSTNYSDTLLQMGRWFGYRPGYLDCCRIFTTADVVERFNSTTRCIEELGVEFDRMHELGKTPSNFLVRVKKHPGVLKITRPSILKNTKEIKWSFQNQLQMTTSFDISKNKIDEVWKSFQSNTAPLFASAVPENDGRFLKVELKENKIIEFLKHPNNFESTTLNSMIAFIELCQEQGALTDWTVAIRLKGRSNRIIKPEFSGLPCEAGMGFRSGPKSDNGDDPNRHLFLAQKIFRATGNSANIMSAPIDMGVSLSKSEIELAEQDYRENKPGVKIPEKEYRKMIPQTNGVLIIYLFDSHYAFKQDSSFSPDQEFDRLVKEGGYNLDIPLIGYAIGFPPIEPDPGKEYVHGDYDLDVEVDSEDENAFEDMALPDDEMELSL